MMRTPSDSARDLMRDLFAEIDAQGITDSEVARRAGLSVGAGMMSHYRAGRHVPSLATLCRLAAAVGLRVDLRPAAGRRLSSARSRRPAIDP